MPAKTLIGDIAVMRASLGADAARWCARNATDEELAAVVAAARRVSDGLSPGPDRIDLIFWEAVVDGSHNVAYRLGLNTLVAGLVEMGYETSRACTTSRPTAMPTSSWPTLIADMTGRQGARALAERLMSLAGVPTCST